MNDKQKMGARVKKQIFLRFLLEAALFTGGYFAVVLLAIGPLRNMISDFLYAVLPEAGYFWMINFLQMMVGVLYVAGIIFMIYRAIKTAVDSVEALVVAIDSVLRKDQEYITIPEPLKFLETEINQVKLETIRSQQIALQAEQRKNELVVYLAHDIRTPLTSVIGYLTLLDEAADMQEEQRRRYISVALSKANSLERLVNEFFEITRYNFQTILLEQESINLKRMLEQMVDEFFPILEEQQKSVELQVQEGIFLYADPDKMARVFNNLLKNAIAYSYSKSCIGISVIKKEGEVAIYFRNQGNQIPPERLASVFEKFYRGDQARSSGGSGLGLAIAKEIVERHGGSISAESSAQATVFAVRLPDQPQTMTENSKETIRIS